MIKYPMKESNPKYLKLELFKLCEKPGTVNQGLGCPNFQICDTQEKSTKDWKVKPPHIFQMVTNQGNIFTPLDLKHMKMGRQVTSKSLKKIKIRPKCPCNPKTPNLQYLANPTLLSKNNTTINFRTDENGGIDHPKTFKLINN